LTDTVEKEPRPEKITTPICLYTPSLAQQKSMNAVFGVFAEDIRSQNTLSFDNHDVETHIIDSAFGEDNILTFVKNCRAKGDRFKFVILRPQTSSSSATKNTDIFNGDFPKPLLPHDVAALVKVIAVWQGKKHTEIDYLNKQRIIAQESQKNGIAKAKKVSDIKIPDCRILVVDDVSFNQILMQKLLEPYGAQIQLAANGQEAVDQFKSKPFDLILMDCQMPVMDGFEATQKIRKLDGGKDTKIIALTADAMIGDREKCLSSGMDDYLNKPVRPNEIKEMIEKWVFNAAKGHKAST